jgi:predicted N-formylglutamate amidohydrolase
MSSSTIPVGEGALGTAAEPPVVEAVNADSDDVVLFICDHASHRIPHRLGDLGLRREEILSHIGWDIGIADLARSLAAGRTAPLVLSGYSRLVIDCNRPPESPGLVPTASAGIAIPGNRDLPADEVTTRRNTFFRPYHAAISELLERRQRERVPTVLLSMHSFTPNYPGEERPWHIDFAYNRDRRLAGLLLQQDLGSGILVGDNQPYAVEDDSDYSIPVHGEQRGIPHVLIEVRQDTLADAEGIAGWADRFDKLLRRLHPALERLAMESLPLESAAKP